MPDVCLLLVAIIHWSKILQTTQYNSLSSRKKKKKFRFFNTSSWCQGKLSNCLQNALHQKFCENFHKEGIALKISEY